MNDPILRALVQDAGKIILVLTALFVCMQLHQWWKNRNH